MVCDVSSRLTRMLTALSCCCHFCQVLVCPDKKRPDENKGKASLGYDEQVCKHCQNHLCPACPVCDRELRDAPAMPCMRSVWFVDSRSESR
jgi:hypothetical protein